MNKRTKSEILRKPCTHLAGEFFVAAELSRRGYNVALTLGNAKRVDLIIEDSDKTVAIQVKAIAKKEFVGWPLNISQKYNEGLLFVLVVLGKPGLTPEYYILSGADVEAKRKNYSTRGIIDISRVKEFKENWSLIDKHLNRSRLRKAV